MQLELLLPGSTRVAVKIYDNLTDPLHPRLQIHHNLRPRKHKQNACERTSRCASAHFWRKRNLICPRAHSMHVFQSASLGPSFTAFELLTLWMSRIMYAVSAEKFAVL